MRNEDQLPALTLAPAAAEFAVKLKEVYRPLVFFRPPGILDLTQFGVHQHQAPGTNQRVHPHIIRAHIPVEILRRLLEERAFQVAPALDHTRQKFRPARVKSWIESNWETQLGGGGCQGRIRGAELNAIGKVAFKGDLIPLTNL